MPPVVFDQLQHSYARTGARSAEVRRDQPQSESFFLAVALRVYLRGQDRTESSSFEPAQPSIRRIGPGNLSLIRRPGFAAGVPSQSHSMK
jgi:hypothetical protein